MSKNNQQPHSENPKNQFSSSKPMTFAQKVEYAIDIMKEKTKSTSTERFEQYYNETFGGNNDN